MHRGLVLGCLFVFLMGMAGCAMRRGPYPSGPHTLEEAAEWTPEGPRRASMDLVLQAAQALERGQPDGARDLASRALRLDGRNPYAHYVLGAAAVEAEEFSVALRYLDQAQLLFSLDPDGNTIWLSKALFLKSDVLAVRGELEEAEGLREQAEALEAGRPLGTVVESLR